MSTEQIFFQLWLTQWVDLQVSEVQVFIEVKQSHQESSQKPEHSQHRKPTTDYMLYTDRMEGWMDGEWLRSSESVCELVFVNLPCVFIGEYLLAS